jgi:hypothetical protein
MSLRSISGGKDGSYVIGAMFTSEYAGKADRLAASCEKFELPYVLHEVATIHGSISPHGSDDLAYTKANFIRHLLAVYKKPVLYLDADCEFVSQPDLIDEFVRSGCDFAIYNWFADSYTDAFVPIERFAGAIESLPRDRFYRFAAGIDMATTDQLKCSGLVQFYRNSFATRSLLSRWQQTIATFPGCADDQALDFTFNNLGRRSWLWWLLKARWLPKSYARISWWIYVKPVINHPELPGGGTSFVKIKDRRGRKQFYRSLIKRSDVEHLFPRDCIIDTEQHMLCKLVDNEVVPLEPTNQTFWL